MPVKKIMETVGSKRVADGDWLCSDSACANLNFSRRTVCNRCNKERDNSVKKKLGQEIGKAAAEKSKGLFSADDWLCKKCCNINWARRQQCNMCNAPKFGDVEERTGFGGGYNDRGVVEYIKRDDSDDEYDEFGRKKKKKNKTKNSTSLSTENNYKSDDEYENRKLIKKDDESIETKKFVAEEEEDELEETAAEEERDELDEDESDSEDLSKYDLTEWDDFTVENNVEQRSKDHVSKSQRINKCRSERSRSRSPL